METGVVVYSNEQVNTLLGQGEKRIKYKIELDLLTRFQLLLTGKTGKGVELFGIGLPEVRGMAFMYPFAGVINYAVSLNYRVFVLKEAGLFGKGDWYLSFIFSVPEEN